MSYIERKAALKAILEHPANIAPFTKKAMDAIENISPADVVEVKHGEWIYHECVSSYDGCKSGYSCSMCNAFVDEEIFDTDEFHKAFCGNCGAKMDGERIEK